MIHLLVKTSKYHLAYSTMVNNSLSKLPIFHLLLIASIVGLFPFVVAFCHHLLVTLIVGCFFVLFVFPFVVSLYFGLIALTTTSSPIPLRFAFVVDPHLRPIIRAKTTVNWWLQWIQLVRVSNDLAKMDISSLSKRRPSSYLWNNDVYYGWVNSNLGRF